MKQTSRCVCKDVSREDQVRQGDGSECGVGVGQRDGDPLDVIKGKGGS